MEHLAAVIVLSAALLASGVLRSLFKLSSPRGRVRPNPLQAARSRRPSNSAKRSTRVQRRPPTHKSVRNNSVENPELAPDTPYRACRTDQTVVGRSQLHQLAHRLSRLESALDVEGVTIHESKAARGGGEPPRQIVEQSRRGLRADEIARNTGLSRCEVELMLKMHASKS